MISFQKYKEDELVTLREAAKLLGVSVSTIKRYRNNGQFPYYVYSKRKLLYQVSDLKEFRDKSLTPACDYEE
jgi:predicted site-specific integrase-resolvase